MAINKNFVIKNGAEVNTKLLVADSVTQKVGIGTTVPTYSLHVFGPNEQPGSIGASVVNVTGVTTTNLLTVGAAATFSVGPVFIGVGQSTGTPLQPLQVGSATTVKGVYISGDTGIGATFPGAKLEVVPESTRIAGLFTGSTSNDMVRITQEGTGNALVVEDEANEDATSFVISGLDSVGIGTNVPRYLLDIDGTKLAAEGVAVGQTAVYIRGDVKIVGDLSADDITLDQIVNNYLNVSGFGTITDLLVPETASINIGIITSIQGGNLSLAGITSFLNAPGITTLSYLTGESANYTGISTLARVTGEDVNLTGIATIARLNVPGISTIGFIESTTLNVSGFSTLGGATATALNVSGITTVGGGFEVNEGINAARLNVTGISTLGSVTATEAVVTGISTLGQVSATGITNSGITTSDSYMINGTTVINSSRQLQNIASLDSATTATIEAAIKNGPNEFTDLKVTGISTLGQATAEGLVVSGVSTIGNFLITPDAAGVGATVGASVGIITYYGDGSNLTGVSIGIQSGGFLVGYGVTTLNFIGAGNTFKYDTATNTVDISIQGGGGGFFNQDNIGITTASAVGIGTTTLDDSDLVGVGNSFQGLYIRNGMMIVDNELNGNHYIGTNFNGLMAGPVTVNGTLTVDGNWVVV